MNFSMDWSPSRRNRGNPHCLIFSPVCRGHRLQRTVKMQGRAVWSRVRSPLFPANLPSASLDNIMWWGVGPWTKFLAQPLEIRQDQVKPKWIRFYSLLNLCAPLMWAKLLQDNSKKELPAQRTSQGYWSFLAHSTADFQKRHNAPNHSCPQDATFF